MRDLPILECRLDLDGLREQHARYQRVGQNVTELRRDELSLTATLSDGTGVDELVSVERECCPFFDITWDGSRLTYSVHPEHAAALDAIEYALKQ